MGTGRSITDFQRVYIGGYDLSGYAMDAGEQGVEFTEFPGYCWADAIKGVLVGKPKVTFGPLVATFDNTATSGFHVLANAAIGTKRNILLARGVRAVPAVGDDVFGGPFYQVSYKSIGQGIVTAKTEFRGVDIQDALLYDEFFGKLVHAYGAETGANAANTPNVDNGASSAAGGWLMYHISAIAGGAGTAAVSIDDSANGTAWAALSGATTGALAYTVAPTSGIVQLGVTATVRQYLRWQLALAGGATGCTFALAFFRGR